MTRDLLKRGKTLYIVIPCYNEEEALPITIRALQDKMEYLISSSKISNDSRIFLVNDGSRDKTWEIIQKLHEENKLFSGLKLSRNRGHQNALLAGLMVAMEKCDFTISMDADLQDDINAVDEMIDEYLSGSEIVYGVRSSRDKDSFFKKFTAEGFYKLINKLGGEVVFNHADYRLMSKTALIALSKYKEVNLFLRGIVPMLGYKSTIVEYERGERIAGESKYPLSKMLKLAFDGITNLSFKPLRFFLHCGILSLLASFIILTVNLIRLCLGLTFTNFQILLVLLMFMSGLILLGIGVLGEYIGKIYLETKERPKFIVEEILD